MKIRAFHLFVLMLFLCIVSYGTSEEYITPSNHAIAVCTCQFETSISMGKYTREMTRFIFVVEGERARACCEAELKDRLPAFKETHKMTQSCPVWSLLEVDTITSTQAREMSCYMPDGVFRIHPFKKVKNHLPPFIPKYYPELKE
ncbi:MAG: hypothetical protein GVX96_03585 [Bacteroidetes bacterium]|nr:hypothetical protein [Bacteroidota bacterium]